MLYRATAALPRKTASQRLWRCRATLQVPAGLTFGKTIGKPKPAAQPKSFENMFIGHASLRRQVRHRFAHGPLLAQNWIMSWRNGAHMQKVQPTTKNAKKLLKIKKIYVMEWNIVVHRLLYYQGIFVARFTSRYSLYELRCPPPTPCAHNTPQFATSAAKLVYRASRKRCSMWPGLEPRPTLNSGLSSILKLF